MAEERLEVFVPVWAPAEEARAVVQGFYQWYLGYAGDPLAERAYRERPELTPSWIARLDEIVSAPTRPRIDPLLHASDRPSLLTIGRVTVHGARARAEVHSSELAHPLTVSLLWREGCWRIDGVTGTVK